jgi:hypothetical protein
LGATKTTPGRIIASSPEPKYRIFGEVFSPSLVAMSKEDDKKGLLDGISE